MQCGSARILVGSVNQQHEGSLSVTLRKQVTIDESSAKGFFKCSTRGVRSSRATSQSKWDRKCDPGSCRAKSYIVVTYNVELRLDHLSFFRANHQHGRASVRLAAALLHGWSSGQRHVHVSRVFIAWYCSEQCCGFCKGN